MQYGVYQANKQANIDEKNYDGATLSMKAILAHLPHQDQKSLRGSTTLKKKMLTNRVNYFLRPYCRIMFDLTTFQDK